MTSVPERLLLGAILLAYVVLALTYSVVSPPFEVSDELWHYPLVRHLAQNGLRLPVQDSTNVGPWRQEGSQPPLYYLLAAALTAGIDTSDMDTVRRINPHADIGVVRPDGNVNMIVHRASAEAFPWSGTVLALRVSRFFSVALGLGTVVVTYFLARTLFSAHPVIYLGATALVAFLPMFLFIAGSVNNDNLSNLLGNLLTLLVVRLLLLERAPNWRDYVLLGVGTGAGLLAKFSIGFLVPLVGLALFFVSLRCRDWRLLVVGGLVCGGLTVAIAGWWYVRNVQLYGDLTGLNVFLDIVGRRAVPANLAQLWSERHSFIQAFWGFFGGMNVLLPEAAYVVFNAVGLVGLLGVAVFWLRSVLVLRLGWCAHSLGLNGKQWLPAAVTVVWPLVTFVSYLRWTAETPASQGRLVFGALSSVALWLAVGLVWWLPVRLRGWMIGGVVVWFASVAAVTPFLVIAPAYAPPQQIAGAGQPVAVFSRDSEPGALALLAAKIVSERVEPEDYVYLVLDWEVVETPIRDWSLFIHLITPDGVIFGQRDVYPGQGALATSDLKPGRAWRNPVAVWVPLAAYAPMRFDVAVGWYHLPTGQRLFLPDGRDALVVGQAQLVPRASDLGVPNPLSVNFGGLIELVGYELTDLSPAPGDTVTLTLFWRALRPISDDYKVFANILDPLTLTKYAASDGMPVQWSAPTSTWLPGVIVEDAHTLAVSSGAPPGIYEVQVGLYLEVPNGAYLRLRVFTSDGGQAFDFISLTRVRVVSEFG
ncbi:MAG: glycosyltransferase family 39 protein [Aggregatilineales bacterium]